MRSIRIVCDYRNFDPKWFRTELGKHRGKDVIWIRFPQEDHALRNMLEQNTFLSWSSSQKDWYIPDTVKNRALFRLPPKITGKEMLLRISEINIGEFDKYRNILLLKGFSQNTVRTYCNEFAQLLYVLGDHPVAELSPEKLQSYFLYCVRELSVSENQLHSRMNAVKFYFEKVMHRQKMFFDIPRPKKPSLLPKCLNMDEVRRLFAAVDNIKHLVMLKLCYGLGLRVSEIVALKISDIDSVQMRVLVERGKGKKDRYVNLPESVLEELRAYYRLYKPQKFLFEGRDGGAYQVRSAQTVFRNAMQKAGISKQVGIHGLRHSYATHLLELGTDISLIQKLLGHESIKTTLNYTNITDVQLCKVKSPLDRI
ncbi:tyrosine-type recombinase/integrase [Daejeonia sp. YH14]|uniref:tyrosine-type recombinase/integrase n=1 Tax=Daejeonia sp. YH14 TaxID=3439042 RepID=UPI003F492B7A